MTAILSNNLEYLLSTKAKEHINTTMVNDIYYFMLNSKADKVELKYGDKSLHIIRTECGGAKLYLEINGKTIDMIPNKKRRN